MADRRFVRSALALAVFSVLCAPAYAQEAASGTSATVATGDGGADNRDADATTLDAIQVVATKREGKLQDIPVVVNVLPAQQLQDAGVRDIKDLQVLVPGMSVTSTQNSAATTVRIWNVGTTGDNPGLESSVGVVIDGVYRPRTGVGFGDLGEIDHIEVLKGPQGTLFGKNTSAGVINVITKAPEYEPYFSGELTFGNYNAVGASGYFTSGVSDRVAISAYAADRQRDGFMDVVTGKGPRTQDYDADQNFHTFRGKLLWEPSDNVDVTFAADYTKTDENCCGATAIVRGSTAPIIDSLAGGKGILGAGDDPADRVAYLNRGTGQHVEDKGLSANIVWDAPWFGGSTLTSITSARRWHSINGGDLDFTGADILYRNADRDEAFSGFKTFSQELHLSGSNGPVDWLVGLFYADEKLDRNSSFNLETDYESYLSTLTFGRLAATGVAIAKPNPKAFLSQISGVTDGFTGLSALDRYQQDDKSVALFTNNTWHATDQLDLTLGLRYTRDRKDLDTQTSNPNGTLSCAAVLENPAAHVRAGLLAQGVTPTPQLLAALTPSIVGSMCLPWSNARFADFDSPRQQIKESEWSGTLKAAYRWNDAIMTYASGSRGYKSGGFNLDRVQNGVVPVTDTSFPGEFVDSYELGAKTTWLGGNLLVNVTGFHQKYSDYQFNGFLGRSWSVISIPELTSKGGDLEVMWRPPSVRGLMLQTGVTYADTRFGDDIPGANFVEPTGALYKLPGSHPSFAPLWSGSASVSYERDIAHDLLFRFNVSAKYTSTQNAGTDLDVEKQQDPFTVLNARVGLGSSDGRWMVELWGMNLTDETYYQVAFDYPLQTSSPLPYDPRNTYGAVFGAPRTYGLTLRVTY